MGTQERPDRFDETKVFELLEHKLPFVNLLRNNGQFPTVDAVVPLADETSVVPVGVIANGGPSAQRMKRFVSIMSDFGTHRLVEERIRIVRNETSHHGGDDEGSLPRRIVTLLENEEVSELLVKIGVQGVGASVETMIDGRLTCALQPRSTIQVVSNQRTIEQDLFDLLHEPGVIDRAARACRNSLIDHQSICLAFPLELSIGSLHIVARKNQKAGGGIDLINELVLRGHVGSRTAAYRTYGPNAQSVLSAEMVLFKSFVFGRDRHTVIIGPFRCRRESDNNFRLATQPIPAITDNVVTTTLQATQTILLDLLRSLEPADGMIRFMFLQLNRLACNVEPTTCRDHIVLMRCILESAAGRYELSDDQRRVIALTQRYSAWFHRGSEPMDSSLDQNAARCHELLKIFLFRILPVHKRFLLHEVQLCGCLGSLAIAVAALSVRAWSLTRKRNNT